MRQDLNENQINFLLEYFFKNEEYAGWKNIAKSLIISGSCVVAGDRCIWIGGVGNFITTEKAEGLFGCLKYTFDLSRFVKSEHFKEIHDAVLLDLKDKHTQIKTKISDIDNIYLRLHTHTSNKFGESHCPSGDNSVN